MADIFASAGINYANASKVGGTGSGIKIFPSLLSATAPAILQLLEQQQAQIVTLSAAGSLFVHGTSPTINPVLQSGSSLTSGSNTTVSTLTSAASLTTNAAYPWALQVKLQGDQASGIVQVVSATFACNGTTSTTFTNTSVTGVSFTGALTDGIAAQEPGVNLVLGINFGVSDALNTASLFEYTLEA
jgi:hypothetical protein